MEWTVSHSPIQIDSDSQKIRQFVPITFLRVYLYQSYTYVWYIQIKSQSPHLLGNTVVSLMSTFPLSEEITFNPFTKSFDIYPCISKLCVYIPMSS